MSPQRIVGYFTSWGIEQRGYQLSDIPGGLLTHVNYAFADVTSSGDLVLPFQAARDETPALMLELKARFPRLKLLLAVGGWTCSKHFSNAVSNDEARRAFASSCLRILDAYPGVFDGFDFDWEFPGGGGMEGNATSPGDRDNFTAFLRMLRRRARDAGIADLILTAAILPDGRASDHFELSALTEVIDWFNVMSYDFAGPWSQRASFHAPLYADHFAPEPGCVAEGVRQLMRSIPAPQLVVGIPFYGRGWLGVPSMNQGLYQSFHGVPEGDEGGGCYSYRALANRESTLEEFWNNEACAPWMYSKKSGLMISHENPRSLIEKVKFIKRTHLGGAMIWELSLDDRAHTLLRTLYAQLVDGIDQPAGP
jgi:chitinase